MPTLPSTLLFGREKRYLSLHGLFIDAIASRLDPRVTPDFIENRLLRDGKDNGHHITVINHLEIKAKLSQTIVNGNDNEKPSSNKQKDKLFKQTQLRLLDSIVDRFGNACAWERPIDLGLGLNTSQDAKAYYRVIHWPFGQTIRHFVGLDPTHFHITVGFSPHDVHQYKGPGSLLCLGEEQPCAKELYSRLIEYVPFYYQDTHFTGALFRTGWRHGYYIHLASLSRILLQCENASKKNNTKLIPSSVLAFVRFLYYRLINKRRSTYPFQ